MWVKLYSISVSSYLGDAKKKNNNNNNLWEIVLIDQFDYYNFMIQWIPLA